MGGASGSVESLVGLLVHTIGQAAKPQSPASLGSPSGLQLCDLAAKLLNAMLELLGEYAQSCRQGAGVCNL